MDQNFGKPLQSVVSITESGSLLALLSNYRMTNRYYSETPISGTVAKLIGGEAHHLLHVMRARPGQQLVVFDGHGGEYKAEVTACGRREVELCLGPRCDVERELSFQLTVAVALPKGDRQRWLIEKSVELGVTRLILLESSRSVLVKQHSDKLGSYVISASKQCGRNRLMEILPPTDWSSLIGELKLGDGGATARRGLLAHPGGLSCSKFALDALADTWIAIGPEGGFTEDEVEAGAAAGWQTVDLGQTILRVETAAIVLAGAIVLGAKEC